MHMHEKQRHILHFPCSWPINYAYRFVHQFHTLHTSRRPLFESETGAKELSLNIFQINEMPFHCVIHSNTYINQILRDELFSNPVVTNHSYTVSPKFVGSCSAISSDKYVFICNFSPPHLIHFSKKLFFTALFMKGCCPATCKWAQLLHCVYTVK